jgi:predicted RNA-binding Zn-ribbon protein involved in translation (DUF1610 family)
MKRNFLDQCENCKSDCDGTEIDGKVLCEFCIDIVIIRCSHCSKQVSEYTVVQGDKLCHDCYNDYLNNR